MSVYERKGGVREMEVREMEKFLHQMRERERERERGGERDGERERQRE